MSTTDNKSNAPPTAAAGSSAAAQAALFAEDPRVHFDRSAGTWRFEQDDGTELEYDAAKAAWVPVVRAQPRFAYCVDSKIFDISLMKI